MEERDDGPPDPVDRPHVIAMRVDVWTGMLSGVATMFAIMCAAAVTLGAHGSVNVQTAEQAPKALFAVGIVGLGLLAVPVLAGATAYAVAEALHWNEGLSRKVKDAPGFYTIIIASMAIGLALVGLGVNPIRALYLSAIFNGLTAPPLILLIIILTQSGGVLGPYRSRWTSLIATSVAGVAMTAFPIIALLKA